jgi:hypothetical protein
MYKGNIFWSKLTFFYYSFVCKSSMNCFFLICCEYFVFCIQSGLFLQKVYEVLLLNFNKPFVFYCFGYLRRIRRFYFLLPYFIHFKMQ